MHWNWTNFCGTSNFSVWDHESHFFRSCFSTILFSIGSHLLLLILSLVHFIKNHPKRLRISVPISLTLVLRLIFSILLVILPLLLIILSVFYENICLLPVKWIDTTVKVVAWLLHSNFVYALQKHYHLTLRGPLSLILAFLGTTFSMAVHLYYVIKDVESSNITQDALDEFVTYFQAGLHLLYLFTLIPSHRRDLPTADGQTSVNINTSADDEPLLGNESTSHQIPLGVAENGSCLSYLSFWWFNCLMSKGAKGHIKRSEDLFELPLKLDIRLISRKFQSTVNKCHASRESALRNVASTLNKTSLLRTLNKSFGCEYYSLGLLKFIGDSLSFAGPILLNLLVTYMTEKNQPEWHGYVYAIGLFSATFLSAMCSTHFGYHINIVGLKVRSAVITAIYRKTLSVSSVELSSFSTGEVVNYMSTDTDRIVNFCPSFHQFWSLPAQMAVALFLLYQQVGIAFLAGLGFAVLLIPLNRWIAVKIGQLSGKMMLHKDSRVKMMGEILAGIRVIKMYSWEPIFINRVNSVRKQEVANLKGRKYLDAICVFLWASTNVMISILTFSTYALLGHKLTAAKVFTSVALFNILIMPLNAFPWVVNGLMEAWVSVKRINRFLSLTDQELLDYYHQGSDGDSDIDINISHAYFTWRSNQTTVPQEHHTSESDSTSQSNDALIHVASASSARLSRSQSERFICLQDLSLSCHQGQLIGVVGKVGCGKSSLLYAILAEMCRQDGQISITCLQQGFGYVGQEAWIQHATVRENIIFGKAFDKEKYNKVVSACALDEDLKILPAGDLTEIGENGVTLSGGQKARVSLARAVYQDKAVYLLDDPLSAVDAHVAEHLFQHCISTLLAGRTRVLCTHHWKFLQHADHVILLDDGRIVKQGPPKLVLEGVDEYIVNPSEKPEQSTVVEGTATIENDVPCILEEPEQHTGALGSDEEQETGVVRAGVYGRYWKAVGVCLAPCVLLALLAMQGSRNASDWWLSYWVTHTQTNNHTANRSVVSTIEHMQPVENFMGTFVMLPHPVLRDRSDATYVQESALHHDDGLRFYLTVFGIIAGANLFFTLLRAFLFAHGGIRSALRLHDALLSTLMKAPVPFFDVTPIGRILNRFSSDVYTVDDSLPFIMNILLAQLYSVTGTIVITCYGIPWFTVVLVPLAILYFFIQNYYRHTSRELKRISSVTLSPIYAHFSETISGLVTIRALRHSQRFIEENVSRLERNQRAQFASMAASNWLTFRLQMIGVTMVTGVAVIAVLEHHLNVTVNAGLLGLALSYALSVTSLLNGVVQSFTSTEQQMVGVERMAQYIEKLPQEPQDQLITVSPSWPMTGAITFNSVVLQYRPGLPNALNVVSFTIHAGEKVGIVGRTGSGKSSLIQALFRLVELQEGSIYVDNVNVAYLQLHQLRSHMAVIPQDPFLFSGTLRDNLDPGRHCTDDDIWTALKRCHMVQPVRRLGGLSGVVAERGRQFSVGQRQLLCLARVLLTKTKIMCIDEATASVDHTTDKLIQKTIHSEFASSTVLTIAHRINTVMDSHRVLVMKKGKVAEFDRPALLLTNEQSLFYKLVNSTNH